MGGPSRKDGFPPPAGEGIGPGSRVAGYLVQEQVGRGGTAVVYRARDLRLDRTVALKVLVPVLAADEAFRLRFIRESRAATAIDDPHIVPVFEAGEADGVLFIAMRFVGGGDVRSLVRRSGPLTATRAAGIISPVASALDAAHAAGLVHRDVKPANMLLDTRPGRPDHVYLSDFGLSKGALSSAGLTGSGMFLGTPDYISPEQIAGRAVDGRADQYALACAAFELLSGEPPFQRDHGMAVIWAHSAESPPALTSRRPGLPPATDGVLAKALAKDPADRYVACQDFADALRAALEVPLYDPERGISQDQRSAAGAGHPPAESPAEAPANVARTRSVTAAGAQATRDAEHRQYRIAEPPAVSPGPAGPGTGNGKTKTGRKRGVLAAVAALVLLGGTGGVLALLTRAPHASHPKPSTGHAFPRIQGLLSSVSAGPGGTAWAVGSSSGASATGRPLILHWDGTAWTRVPSPNDGAPGPKNAGRSFLNAATAGPGGTAWAVGSTSSVSATGRELILHWDGTAWTRVPSQDPGVSPVLYAVAAGPGGTAWAVGSHVGRSGNEVSLIMHWNGTAWKRVPSPNPDGNAQLWGVSAGTGGTAWAVGQFCTPACTAASTDQTLILHWDGTAWKRVPSPNPSSDSRLWGVGTGPGGTAWAVGYACMSSCGGAQETDQTLILRWDGTAWTRVPSPNPSRNSALQGVSAGPGGTAWAVGGYTGPSRSGHTLILRWDGTAWTRVPSPNPGRNSTLQGVSAGLSGTAWAVGLSCTPGCYGSGGTTRTLILHWDGTTWSAG